MGRAWWALFALVWGAAIFALFMVNGCSTASPC